MKRPEIVETQKKKKRHQPESLLQDCAFGWLEKGGTEDPPCLVHPEPWSSVSRWWFLLLLRHLPLLHQELSTYSAHLLQLLPLALSPEEKKKEKKLRTRRRRFFFFLEPSGPQTTLPAAGLKAVTKEERRYLARKEKITRQSLFSSLELRLPLSSLLSLLQSMLHPLPMKRKEQELKGATRKKKQTEKKEKTISQDHPQHEMKTAKTGRTVVRRLSTPFVHPGRPA